VSFDGDDGFHRVSSSQHYLLVGHVHISTGDRCLLDRVMTHATNPHTIPCPVSWTYMLILYFPLWKYHTHIAVVFYLRLGPACVHLRSSALIPFSSTFLVGNSHMQSQSLHTRFPLFVRTFFIWQLVLVFVLICSTRNVFVDDYEVFTVNCVSCNFRLVFLYSNPFRRRG
jgi:hypothetical protein